MLKFILTQVCPRQCSYCIVKNMPLHLPNYDIVNVAYRLKELSETHREIMITGGEPTMRHDYDLIVRIAKKYFDYVYITTQNPSIFNSPALPYIDAITYSLHDYPAAMTPYVRVYEPTGRIPPVYAAILATQYDAKLAFRLKAFGYSGLTINEEQRHGKRFVTFLPRLKDFSIRVNRKGKCMNDTILLPDLTIINSFKDYL